MIRSKLSDYEERNGIFSIYTKEERYCPDCGGVLKYRDSRKRKVVVFDEMVQIYRVRRFVCGVCGKMHTELPETVIAHSHYGKKCIKAAVAGDVSRCYADASTISRWKKRYGQNGWDFEDEDVG